MFYKYSTFLFSISISLALCKENAVLSEKFSSKANSTLTSLKWKCDLEDEAKIDVLVGQIMSYGREDVRFPESVQELKTFCK